MQNVHDRYTCIKSNMYKSSFEEKNATYMIRPLFYILKIITKKKLQMNYEMRSFDTRIGYNKITLKCQNKVIKITLSVCARFSINRTLVSSCMAFIPEL